MKQRSSRLSGTRRPQLTKSLERISRLPALASTQDGLESFLAYWSALPEGRRNARMPWFMTMTTSWHSEVRSYVFSQVRFKNLQSVQPTAASNCALYISQQLGFYMFYILQRPGFRRTLHVKFPHASSSDRGQRLPATRCYLQRYLSFSLFPSSMSMSHAPKQQQTHANQDTPQSTLTLCGEARSSPHACCLALWNEKLKDGP